MTPQVDNLASLESEKDALITENQALKQQSEALSNAAQAIGLTLQGRLKDVEARHEAEILRGNIQANSPSRRKSKVQRHSVRSEDFARDSAFFLAGVFCTVVVMSVARYSIKTN